MARPVQDRQIRINEILDAADQLFFSKGYYDTTISDIAKSIGVAQGMLYYYFKSKEEVLEKLLQRYAADLVSEVRAIYDSSNTPTKKITLILSVTLDKACYKKGLLLDMLYDVHNLHIKAKLFQQLALALKPWLVRIIEDGIEAKEFKVSYASIAVEYILAIADFLSAAIYKNSFDDMLIVRIKMAEKLIEKALETKDGSIHISLPL